MEDKLSQHQRFHQLCRDLPYLPPRVMVTPGLGLPLAPIQVGCHGNKCLHLSRLARQV